VSDRATPDDRTLIAKAVTQGLFGEGALTAAAEVSAPDRYAIVRCLGRGGMGVVYLARDRTLERLVALKVLASASAADVERLRREARFTARLASPHIVSVYDLGEHEGQAFIAMQYVDGGNLAEASLGRAPLVRTIATVARALHVAHEEGIVHRDVKPENILVDREGRPFITDFGIARDLRSEEHRTHDGLVVGTPALMSPEQARGQPRAVDRRTDVYGLGATLYALIARRPPFRGSTVVDVLHAVLHDRPASLRSLDPTVPVALEEIVLRCLAKEKRDRYQSMLDLARDLDAFVGGMVLWPPARLPPPPAPPQRAGVSPETDWTGALEAAAEIARWDTDRYRVARDLTKTYPRLDGLVARLEGILAVRPDAGWARFYRGVALARRGKLVRALEDMERAIDALSDSAQAHFELGRLYLELALREHEESHRHLSVVGGEHERHAARGRIAQALVELREAERLREGLPAWQFATASAVARLAERDYEGCARACEAILEREPEVEDVWKLKGDAERLAGKDPFASYDRALEIRRSFWEALFGKARAHLDRGSAGLARESLTRALELDADLPEARVLLARTFLGEPGLGESALQEGLRHVARVLESAPHDHEALVTKAELEIALERTLRTKEWSERALETLGRARGEAGCQNRVQLLDAWARIERARTSRARGEDVGDELDAVAELASSERAHIPERAWRDVLDAVDELRGSRTGRSKPE
jgi:tetratricopeptide (TPR) repeat protein/predicted Ser/Thr protein kinase